MLLLTENFIDRYKYSIFFYCIPSLFLHLIWFVDVGNKAAKLVVVECSLQM